MKSFLLLVAAIAAWVIVWRCVAKYWRNKGRGALLSHVFAAVSSFVVFIAALLVFLPSESKHGAADVSTVAVTPPVAGRPYEGNAEGNQASASGPVSRMPTAFTGAASEGAVTAENWPTAVTIALAQSDDEKRYLADQTCLDETACYGPKRFQRYILKRYTDLTRVRYQPLPDEADDSEVVFGRRERFFQSLYFAKQIRLADGQSLYDFMRSCSRGFTALDSAEVAFDDKTKASYFDLQYFPTLKRVGTGEPVELQMLFERRGDKLIAGSPFFTSNALKYPDFLQRHNLTCWNDETGRAAAHT